MSARRCARCGRETNDPRVMQPDDDHGPIEVVWCRDPASCEAARKARRSRLPRSALRP